MFDTLLVARAASASGGLLNLLGAGITRIDAEVLPWREPTLSVVARFLLDEDDIAREHEVHVQVIAPDDSLMAVIGWEMAAAEVETLRHETLPGELWAAHFIGDMPGLRFHDEGIHELVVDADGEEVLRYPLPVALRTG